MLSNPTTSNKPTHRIYAVTRSDRSDKGFWSEIGAAWANKDGKGLSLKLNMLPLGEADLVIREIDEDAERAYRERRMALAAADTTTSDLN